MSRQRVQEHRLPGGWTRWARQAQTSAPPLGGTLGTGWSPIPWICHCDLGSVLGTQAERQKGRRSVLSTEILREQGPSTQGPVAAGGLGGAPQARGHESPALCSRESWDTGAYLGLWVPREGGEKPQLSWPRMEAVSSPERSAAFLEAHDSLGPLLT